MLPSRGPSLPSEWPHGPGLPRDDQPEWLDQGRGSPRDVAINLAEMARINRWLGGLPALTRHLYPRILAAASPVTVLDLGTGSAEFPARLAAWARARGRDVRVIAVDWAARNLAVARRHARAGVSLLQADALQPPLPAGGVDFVISSLFLHHFAPAAAADLLRGAARLARRAVIMTDLVRGRLPMLAFRLVRPIFARHPLTSHDGLLSIRRAYVPRELRALAAAAGLAGARV
ncbi:MAG: methyltransferase domain-containing protein, partial [Anaerolineales bacterium]